VVLTETPGGQDGLRAGLCVAQADAVTARAIIRRILAWARVDARFAATWFAVALLATGAISLAECARRPPAPRGADQAAATEVSEARALTTTRRLIDLGLRVAGTPAADRAAELLATELRAIPRLEVEIQRAEGRYRYGDVVFDYQVRNVVARLPGRRRDALLVGAHYDSPPESVGAADNGLAVGVVVELARALAAGPQLERSIVLVLNGGEEASLLGADGFLSHPLAADVRAFINVDAAGVAGQPILFQAGAGGHPLAAAYAAGPRPFGTILGQDIFQAGLIASDTDGRVWRGAPAWPGLDLALFEGGYFYHTRRDTLEHLGAGSAQGLGDQLLATIRALAADARPLASSGSPIYFDVLQRVMFVYGAGTALALALAGLAIAGLAIAVAVRRRCFTLREAAAGAGCAALGWLLGLIFALAVGLALSVLVDRPHGWFAAPGRGLLAFGAAALLGQLAPQLVWRRRRERHLRDHDAGTLAAWAGATLWWSGVSLCLALAGIGTGYLAMLWSLLGGLGLLAAAALPARSARLARLRLLPLGIALGAGLVITTSFGAALIRLFVPMAGRMRTPFELDPVIAVVVALPVLAGGTLAVAASQRAGRAGVTALATELAGLAGLILCAAGFPYSPEAPKRIVITQIDGPGAQRIEVAGMDALPPDRLGLVDSLVAAAGTPAAPAAAPAVAVTPLSGEPARRRVRLVVAAGEYHELVLTLPRARLVSWSLDEPLPEAVDDVVLVAIGHGQAGYSIELTLTGDSVEASVEARFLDLGPAVERALAVLPDWCAGEGRRVTRQRVWL
jgi:hypothetical protein